MTFQFGVGSGHSYGGFLLTRASVGATENFSNIAGGTVANICTQGAVTDDTLCSAGTTNPIFVRHTGRKTATGGAGGVATWTFNYQAPTCAEVGGAAGTKTLAFTASANGVDGNCSPTNDFPRVSQAINLSMTCVGLGGSCASDAQCISGNCVDDPNTAGFQGTCCTAAVVACNGACLTGLCGASGSCTARANGTACGSAASSACDNPDSCSGGVCVTNNVANGTACTTDNNPCTTDTCSGGACTHPAVANGTACPDDGNPCTTDTCSAGACAHPAGNAGATCRASQGACDPAETCTGASAACPADAKSTAVCRASQGVCDPAESCDGVNNACPADAKSTAVCRASQGVCDPAESCNGVGNGCPADVRSPAGTQCRAAGGVCDVAESCDGASAGCPADAKKVAGTVCRPQVDGTCDIPETCDGATNACPPDAFAAPGTVCRPANGACDVAEVCGAGGTCPADGFKTAGTSCRNASCAAGVATAAESCTGSAAACPGPNTTQCNPYVCGPTACKASCALDTDCQATFYCAGSTCSAKKADGLSCQAAKECLNGNCVDGVCCNVACAGQCQACDVAGKVGTCSPVSGAPHGSRTACQTDGSACGGTCDGVVTVSCSYPGAATSCRAAACDAGTNVATLPASCSGTGSCPAKQTQACAPFLCKDAFTCKGDCSTNNDCQAGFFCSASVCKAKLADGASCQDAGQCANSNCVDGVCCNKPCNGQCEACAETGKVGTCTAVTGTPKGSRAACVTDGSACGGTCDGTVTATCTYPSSSTNCRAGSCTNDTAIVPASCDGAGKCPAEQQQSCAPFKCMGTACAGDCKLDTDCQGSKFCSAGVCKEKLTDGTKCGGNNECVSANCVDGVCCDTKCDGQCEACNVTGSVGTCSAVTGAPQGARPQCTTDGSVCGGTCDGVNHKACTFPDNKKQCRTPTCTNATATLEAFCTGAGACPPEQKQSCGNFACDTDGLCAGDCKLPTDCLGTAFCSGGVCKDKVDNGKDCQSADQCKSGFCADGVCCNAKCDGQCEACDNSGKLGTCSPATGSPHKGHPACAGSGPCGATCDGTKTNACTFPGTTTTCGAATCMSGVSTGAPTCDGSGMCGKGAQKSCGNFACGANGNCLTTCSGATDCATGFTCSGGSCVSGTGGAGGGAGAAGAAGKSGGAGTGGSTGGGAGSSGSAGKAGASGTAGAAGTGGTGGAAGSSAGGSAGNGTAGKGGAAGGSSAGKGGAAGAVAGVQPDPNATEPETDGACACSTVGGETSASLGGLAFLIAAAIGRIRRKRAA